jgi:hypothetical protein
MLQWVNRNSCNCKKMAWMRQPQYNWHLVHTDYFANNRPIYANLFTWGCRSLAVFGKRLDVKYSLRLKEPIHYRGLSEVSSAIG